MTIRITPEGQADTRREALDRAKFVLWRLVQESTGPLHVSTSRPLPRMHPDALVYERDPQLLK